MNFLLRYLGNLKFKILGVRLPLSCQIAPSASVSQGRLISLHRKVLIDAGVIIRPYGGNISIGPNSTVNPYCVLYGHGGLRIGSGVRIATGAVFAGVNHNFNSIDDFIFHQGWSHDGIIIEDDVWIGAGAIILDGVTVGQGCIIGAGSVVTKSLEPYGVYVGNPAKLVRRRQR